MYNDFLLDYHERKKKTKKIKSNFKKLNQKQTTTNKQTNRRKKPNFFWKSERGKLKTPNEPSHKKGRQFPFQVPNSNSNAARKWKFLGASVSFSFGKRTLNLSLSPCFSRELCEFSVNSVSVAKEEEEDEEEEEQEEKD